MGSSSWIYFVPYQSDVSKALEELRQQVFERGEYLAPDDLDPQTPDEALLFNGTSTTGSILDILGISDMPIIVHASPLPQDDLFRLFGMLEPTRQQAEAKEEQLQDLAGKLQAIYLTIYEDGVPKGLCFAGYS